ncbi:class I SAM-dependent methyltransferase [Gemella sanguinis]|uniref:class I SAM-dependent methyltransferase n=1 Tax=Gemella sanguinis TaxID=84135 RepID=UPI0004E0B8F4|nr:class I SAM-dependent methyltransferase [Gemella sanguinis]NKZ25114.1 class I SAM-dependent methyltransferase [Gemella sanguinis]
MSDLEKLFFKIDKEVEKIKGEGLYFEGLIKYLTLENDDDYFDIVDNYDKETIRKVYQFLLLKALKELNNPSYDITPEVITMYISHLIECIYGDKKVSITDLASGSGSLLINIAALVKGEKEITSVDVDSNYVRLQQNIFNLLETNVGIINQDALKPLNIKKQDIVISDVPFGYYADEDNSLNYKLCSTDGYSLNALLFIEQAANYLDENGVGILVIPKKVLELEDNFKKYLEEDINLNAVITLPDEMFKNASQQKAIILITKKGQTRLPNQVFLAQIPSFQNKASYAKFIEEFNEWLENN